MYSICSLFHPLISAGVKLRCSKCTYTCYQNSQMTQHKQRSHGHPRRGQNIPGSKKVPHIVEGPDGRKASVKNWRNVLSSQSLPQRDSPEASSSSSFPCSTSYASTSPSPLSSFSASPSPFPFQDAKAVYGYATPLGEAGATTEFASRSFDQGSLRKPLAKKQREKDTPYQRFPRKQSGLRETSSSSSLSDFSEYPLASSSSSSASTAASSPCPSQGGSATYADPALLFQASPENLNARATAGPASYYSGQDYPSLLNSMYLSSTPDSFQELFFQNSPQTADFLAPPTLVDKQLPWTTNPPASTFFDLGVYDDAEIPIIDDAYSWEMSHSINVSMPAPQPIEQQQSSVTDFESLQLLELFRTGVNNIQIPSFDHSAYVNYTDYESVQERLPLGGQLPFVSEHPGSLGFSAPPSVIPQEASPPDWDALFNGSIW